MYSFFVVEGYEDVVRVGVGFCFNRGVVLGVVEVSFVKVMLFCYVVGFLRGRSFYRDSRREGLVFSRFLGVLIFLWVIGGGSG